MGNTTPTKLEDNTYGYILPGSEDGDNGPIHVHPMHTAAAKEVEASGDTGEKTWDGPSYLTFTFDKWSDAPKTLYEGFQRGLKVSKNRPCFGTRPIDAEGNAGPYAWKTYKQVWEEIQDYGSGLINLDLVPENEDGLALIAHYSKNREEWCISEQACNAYGQVVVPLYDTLGPDVVKFILNQTGISTVLCSSEELATMMEVKGDVPSLASVIVMEASAASEEAKAAATEAGFTLYSFDEVKAAGAVGRRDVRPPSPEDCATFCYTSGTTGDPKGAMLSHRNIISDSTGAMVGGAEMFPHDVHLSYLPLAHMFERAIQATILASGGSVGFYQGDTRKIVEDLKALRPTIFPSVPRLYNKIYDKVVQGAAAAGGLKATLFGKAIASKSYWLERGYLKHQFWDTLVFKKVKAKVGLDRARLLVTGSAPIADHVMAFLRSAFGVMVLEGYGQTEGSAASSLTKPDDFSTGHVGGPMSQNEIKLVSVPDMDYLVSDTHHGREVIKDEATGEETLVKEGIRVHGRGEICFRGPNIFMGYYKNEKKTAEAIDEDGWLHSGDIGCWLPSGALKIVDRKKNIFKLSQGEYVAAEKIENVYAASPFVAQSFVYGDSMQSCLVAIVVPDEEYLTNWASKNGVAGSFDAMCSDDKVIKAIDADMKRVGVEGKLRGFEKVKAITVVSELFSAENGLLTPTFKLKRPIAKKVFKESIDAMYASGIGVVAGKSGLEAGAVSK